MAVPKTFKPTVEPLYEQLATHFEKQIRGGKYSSGQKLKPEDDLAAEFGVSRPTLRKAMGILLKKGLISKRKGKGTFVTSPSEGVGRRLHIGLLGLAERVFAEDPFRQEMARGMEEALAECPRAALVVLGNHQPIQEMLEETPLDGALIYASADELPRLASKKLNDTPHCFLSTSSEYLRRQDNVCVNSDNIGGAVTAINHLHQLGHQRIEHFTWSGWTENARERLVGYRNAMSEIGVTVTSDMIHDASEHGSDGPETIAYCEQELKKCLARQERPTAIFSSGLMLTAALVHAAHNLGIDIPRDLSVISFDDAPIASRLIPPVTVIRQDFKSIGKFAVESVLRQIQGKPLVQRQVTIDTMLVERASCLAPSYSPLAL